MILFCCNATCTEIAITKKSVSQPCCFKNVKKLRHLLIEKAFPDLKNEGSVMLNVKHASYMLPGKMYLSAKLKTVGEMPVLYIWQMKLIRLQKSILFALNFLLISEPYLQNACHLRHLLMITLNGWRSCHMPWVNYKLYYLNFNERRGSKQQWKQRWWLFI